MISLEDISIKLLDKLKKMDILKTNVINQAIFKITN